MGTYINKVPLGELQERLVDDKGVHQPVTPTVIEKNTTLIISGCTTMDLIIKVLTGSNKGKEFYISPLVFGRVTEDIEL